MKVKDPKERRNLEQQFAKERQKAELRIKELDKFFLILRIFRQKF